MAEHAQYIREQHDKWTPLAQINSNFGLMHIQHVSGHSNVVIAITTRGDTLVLKSVPVSNAYVLENHPTKVNIQIHRRVSERLLETNRCIHIGGFFGYEILPHIAFSHSLFHDNTKGDLQRYFTYMLATEYIPSLTLHNYVKQILYTTKSIKERERIAKTLILQMMFTLHCLNKENITHGDCHHANWLAQSYMCMRRTSKEQTVVSQYTFKDEGIVMYSKSTVCLRLIDFEFANLFHDNEDVTPNLLIQPGNLQSFVPDDFNRVYDTAIALFPFLGREKYIPECAKFIQDVYPKELLNSRDNNNRMTGEQYKKHFKILPTPTSILKHPYFDELRVLPDGPVSVTSKYAE